MIGAPEVTYGPEYKSGTYSGPQSPTSFDASSFTSSAEHQMGLLIDVTTAYWSNAGKGFADSAAGLGYSLWHPVKPAKTLWNEVVQTVAHPVLTAQGIWGGWKSGISDFMQADAAGRAGIIGETAGHNGFDVTLAVLAAEAPSVVHNIRAGVAGKGGTTVLGHYPEYVKLAEKLDAKVFQVPTEVWNKMTPAEQWAANAKFLDRAITRGDTFQLATKASEARAGSFFERELQYLAGKGYTIGSGGTSLLPPVAP